MKRMTFQLEILEEHYSVPRGTFHSDVAIVDNGIANDISPEWDYTKGIPIAVGILHEGFADVMVAESIDDHDFKVLVLDTLQRVGSQRPLYSFNAEMEHGNFKGAFGIEIPIQEIKPFRAKGWTRDRFFTELIRHKKIPDVKIFDPLGGNGSEVMNKWKQYLVDKDTNHLMGITFHNLRCLLCESVILKNQAFFREHWVIDDGGFMLREKQ